MKIRDLQLETTVLDPARFPRAQRREVAVAGRSNVGKSSLLNMLFGRRNIARTSREPGKTRTINFYLVNEKFYLVDLPGYGFARASKQQREQWQAGIAAYLDERPGLVGVIQLVDARHEPMASDMEMLQRIAWAGRDVLIVLTKADKLRRSQRAGAEEALRDFIERLPPAAPGSAAGVRGAARVPYLFASTVNGEGKDEIWKWIGARI